MKDYKDTLHMPKTDFPMRGNLGKKEPSRQTFWEEHGIYQKRLGKNKANPDFVMPDGPPYANGD
ncbi:MAG: class I tRNA ligase family protein, partial [Candidatus Izemoplasmataceae bacterium]